MRVHAFVCGYSSSVIVLVFHHQFIKPVHRLSSSQLMSQCTIFWVERTVVNFPSEHEDKSYYFITDREQIFKRVFVQWWIRNEHNPGKLLLLIMFSLLIWVHIFIIKYLNRAFTVLLLFSRYKALWNRKNTNFHYFLTMLNFSFKMVAKPIPLLRRALVPLYKTENLYLSHDPFYRNIYSG